MKKRAILSIALISSIYCAESDATKTLDTITEQETVASSTLSTTKCQEVQQEENASMQETSATTLAGYAHLVLRKCIIEIAENMRAETKAVVMQDHAELIQQMLEKNLTSQEIELLNALVAHGSIDRVFKSLQETLEVICCDVKRSMISSGEIQENELLNLSISCGLTTKQ